MTEAHDGMSTEDEDSMDEDGHVNRMSIEVPKDLQIRVWRAKILKGKKIKDLICKGLESELRRLHL